MRKEPARPRTARRVAAPIRPVAPRENRTGARLERLLHLLPTACRPEGVPIAELAVELGVEPKTLLADLAELRERSFHLPPGSPDFTVIIDGDRIQAWSPGDFKRPLRLTVREALALDLALRTAARAPESTPHGSRDALRRKLDRGLSRAAAAEPAGAGAPSDDLRPLPITAPELEEDLQSVRQLLVRAARERTPCSIAYVKPGQSEVDVRTVHPYAVVHAEGEWYLLARCARAEAVRKFRADRIIEVSVETGSFERPANLDPAAHFPEGRILDAGGWTEATVRYAPPVARWVAEEEASGRWEPDGSYTVRRPVADPEWLFRHVLAYAGDAVVVDPPELRSLVAARARQLAGIRADARDADAPLYSSASTSE